MAAASGRLATHVVVWLVASCVVSSADEAGAAVTRWGVDDQTAVVGLLFELRLPSVNTTSVLRVSSVSWTSINLSIYHDVYENSKTQGLKHGHGLK